VYKLVTTLLCDYSDTKNAPTVAVEIVHKEPYVCYGSVSWRRWTVVYTALKSRS